MVGEGANLGFTQRGRVEAALAGRKLNTDALDNSAGVDTSDHEVNIKIAISGPERGQAEGRDALLFGMTDEVAALVLRDNYQQSQAISVAEAQAAEEHDRLERFMRALERHGRLDRAVEFLPDPAAMRARGRPRQYLTRPELSVLLAYAKIDLTDEILDSDLPDDPLLEGELLRYFPTTLQQKFEPQLRSHRLRREIATLQVVNSLVNRCGPTFVRTVGQRTGAPAATIARAFAVVRDAWKLRDLWDEDRGARLQSHGARRRLACWSRPSASCCARCNGPCAACRSRSTPWPLPNSSAPRWRRWVTCRPR